MKKNASDQTDTARLEGISNNALGGDTLPSELKILAWGTNTSDRGDLVVNDVSLAALQKQIAKKSFARICIDFEHSSEKESPAYIPPPRHHAGYGTLAVRPNDGVYLTSIIWTDSGQKYARDYSDMSPTVAFTKKKEIVFVKSLALCPNGSIHDLTFYEATQAEQEMQEMEKIEQLQAQITEQHEQIEQLQADLKALQDAGTANETKGNRETTQVETLSAAVEKLSNEVDGLHKELENRDKQALLDAALQEGKQVNLSEDAISRLSCDQILDHITKLPVTVPLEARTPRHTPPDGEGGEEGTLLDQYNAIREPDKRAEFYAANKDKMFA